MSVAAMMKREAVPAAIDQASVSPARAAGRSVRFSGVAVDYGALRVLQPTQLEVEEGEFLTILGPSGSGKTTILKLIGGFILPSEGSILFDARDITRLPPEKRPFNTVFQDYALFPHMSVAENVAYSQRIKGIGRPERLTEAANALTLVGLEGFASRRIGQLSGGQQQRVALARAIVAKPSVILLDEPLSALDAALRVQMQSFLKSIQRRLGTTFVFVTHDQQEALAISDRIVVMNHGRIVQVGTPTEIYDEPVDSYVAGFIGRNNLVQARYDGSAGLFRTAIGDIAARPSNPPSVADCMLAIRPEHIAVLRPGRSVSPEGRHRAQAVVREVTYAGTHFSYEVEVGHGDPVTIECVGRSGTDGPFQIGDAVEIAFSADDMRILTS